MALSKVSIPMHVAAANALHGTSQVAQCLAWPKQCMHAPDNAGGQQQPRIKNFIQL